jgi:hypothetical protein
LAAHGVETGFDRDSTAAELIALMLELIELSGVNRGRWWRRGRRWRGGCRGGGCSSSLSRSRGTRGGSFT